MGRWRKTPRPWVLCIVVVLLAIHGSIGPISNFVQQLSRPSHVHPWAHRILLSATSGPPPDELGMKLQPSSMLAPSILSPLEPPSTDHDPSPSYMIPPLSHAMVGVPEAGLHEKATNSNSPVPVPHTLGQAVPPKSIAFPVIHGNGYSMPTTAPPKELSNHLTPADYSFPEGPAVSPTSITSPTIHGHGYNMPVAAPQKKSSSHLSPVNYLHTKAPAVSPTSISVPANHGNRYRMPVAAPPTDPFSNLSPVNNSHPKGPATSPTSITSPTNHKNRYGMPVAAAPTESSSHLSPVYHSHPKGPAMSPRSVSSPANHGNRYDMPVAAPSTESSSHLSPVNHLLPKVSTISPISITSPGSPQNGHGMPVAAPPKKFSRHWSPVNYSHPKRPGVSLAPTTPPANYGIYGMPIPAPPKDISSHLSPKNYLHTKGSFPIISPAPHEADRPSGSVQSPVLSPPASTSGKPRAPQLQPFHSLPPPSPGHSSHINYSHPKRPVVSPAPTISPANYGRYGMLVPAPPKDISSHLSPKNYLHTKGSFPVISPTPHEADRSSGTVHSPFTSPSQPPVQRRLHSPTPAPLFSFHQPTARERTGSPASAPSPQSYNTAPSHLPAILPKYNREHHAPPPYVQGPVQSSVLSPSTSASRKPWAPQLRPFHSLPPLSPSHSSLINYSHPKRPVVSPTPTTSPANYGRYGMPVPAPPKDISSHLSPKNYVHTKGSFPVISPAPHEADRPSGTVHSPFTSPPQPPIQRRLHSPAPAPLFSLRQPTARERTRSVASAPSPQSYNPASSHPPAVLPKHNREHHAPPPYVQGPVQSPVLPPSASASRKPWAPQFQPFHSLPPPPHRHSSPKNYSHPKSTLLFGPAVSPAPVTPPANYGRYGMPVPAPSRDISSPLSSKNYSHTKGSFPVISPAPHEAHSPSYSVHSPFTSHPQPPIQRIFHSPAPTPVVSFRHPTARERTGSPTSTPSPQSRYPAPSHPPALLPKHSRWHHAPPPYVQGPSVSQAPFHSTDNEGTPAPAPSKVFPSTQNKGPVQSPVLSPSASASGKPRASQLQPFHSLPPPPPNLDCKTPLSCPEPSTNSPPGSPCACVMPIRVGLRLSIALYAFFPLVSELAQEIASGVSMKQSQVRIMGANATSEEYDKTIVLIDLVPLGDKFDYTTAFLVYEKFWHKQVFINASSFGDYDVLYVYYPGLPPSPPIAPGNIDNGNGNDKNSSTIDPLAADVRKQKERQNGTVIAIIVVAAVIALALCVGAAWVFLLKHRELSHLPIITPQMSLPPFSKASVAGSVPTIPGSRPSSASASFNSSIATCAGSAKTFSLAEMERATNKFNDSQIIGEGGFGRVYEGTLEDGRKAAIKVLKREDQHGGREFLAEVEMLSRLHHRNLVKLIGICTEEHVRCLVYELVPNGSVESHLYGAHKQSAPLDWNARLKIALGAARGLAYLHEDSSPRVIHRDFKASNILLEDDLTPKVSDFGLARTALDEGNEHISTHVMGTFGYLAPEYAMTGHLLVKSDVYSYGVVLLELLTGRKPVDMLRPPGQENLVTWAHPHLTSKDGLETIIDPSLGTIPFDSMAKVAAIASMCVQPEVNQRPFMGEVVQALKLVCNEGNEHRGSGSFSQEETSTQDMEIRISTGLDLELERVISASDIFSTSARFTRDVSGSFWRYSRSGPLRTGRSGQFWNKARGLLSGSASEHGRFGTSLENGG
uniref:Proline-rich protein 36 isoform X14 n=1 Tax=Elaeis guineensis var. tenera TaxID=51953 RepID=A0A8N4ICY0_ELAGV|nr:proline-rich protein 36 isoform X14 [Elaeis guineensis]